jgi:Na+-transporting NADH:ubiquinone oxidoreductase subunit A
VKTVNGASIDAIVASRLKNTGAHQRIISGNVLTGYKVSTEGYLRFPYRQVTVIPEGDDVAEFMGWASLSSKKMSTSRSFPGHFLSKVFTPDARILGGRRAMITSGDYDKVLPMDILAEYLLKAIISKDIDKMEQLGIYEVAPEDFALPEYVDVSKQELQKLVREGLDYLRAELG